MQSVEGESILQLFVVAHEVGIGVDELHLINGAYLSDIFVEQNYVVVGEIFANQILAGKFDGAVDGIDCLHKYFCGWQFFSDCMQNFGDIDGNIFGRRAVSEVVASAQKEYTFGLDIEHVGLEPYQHSVCGIAGDASIVYVGLRKIISQIVHFGNGIAQKYYLSNLGALIEICVSFCFGVFDIVFAKHSVAVYVVGYCKYRNACHEHHDNKQNRHNSDIAGGKYMMLRSCMASSHNIII